MENGRGDHDENIERQITQEHEVHSVHVINHNNVINMHSNDVMLPVLHAQTI